jgi:type IV pilus assembly protein PilY1
MPFKRFLILFLGIFLNVSAHAEIIYNSINPSEQNIALGVNPEGHLNSGAPSNISLNASATGIARVSTVSGVSGWRDGIATSSPDCCHEGWGVSGNIVNPDGTSGGIIRGYAKAVSGGISNLQVKSFTSDELGIISTVWIKDALDNPILEVTHKYGRSAQAPNVLFQGVVTITNISGKTVNDLRYNRSVQWNIPPTGSKLTHSGVAASVGAAPGLPRILYAGDNGFMTPDPMSPARDHYISSNQQTFNTDFVQKNNTGNGSSFTFQFGNLFCGLSSNFMIFYGAANARTDLINALTLEGVSIYSIGENNQGANPFAFGFKGLDGQAFAPSVSPKTAALPGQYQTNENIVQTYAPPVLSSISTTSGATTTVTKYIYQAIFKYRKNKQWFGDILRYKLLDNGDFDPSEPLSAATKLQSKLTAASMNLPYQSDTAGGRSIWTVGRDLIPSCSMTTGVSNDTYNNSFNLTNSAKLGKLLFNCANQVTTEEISNVINFVRGRDVFWEGTRTKSDPRPSILGDTFHSEMVLVGAPNDPVSASASKTTEAYYRYQKGYASFVTANQSRRKQFYVGANDGMLHAFDENLNERWAFIPPSVLNKLRDMMGTIGSSAGSGRSNTAYNVDGPITVKDVYIEAEQKWKTILMGGLGHGGKSYYVLDITDPDKPQHVFTFNHDLTRKLVEFWAADGMKSSWNYSCFGAAETNCPGGNGPISSPNPGTRPPDNLDYEYLGDAWSRPIITRLPLIRTDGVTKETWVAVFGAGYGNGDAVFTGGTQTDYGRYIYVVDLEPDLTTNTVYTTPSGGAAIAKISVAGDASSDVPFGVASPLTAINSDGTSLANYYGSLVYFTDLHGQLWKLNLSKTSLDGPNDIFQLNRLFKTESTLERDRQGFNQLASTIVSSNQIFHYFGSGDQVNPQKRDAKNNNRIYGIRDLDFPTYLTTKSGDLSVTSNPSLVKNVDGLKDNTTDLTACSTSNWYTNAYTRTTFGTATSDYSKVIGRGRLFNSSILFSVYRPEDTTCSLYGSSQLIELNTATCSSVVKNVATGLAVAPVSDNKGNTYVGVSNLKPGTAVASGKDNIFKTTSVASSSSTSQKIKIKSWREKRNN